MLARSVIRFITVAAVVSGVAGELHAQTPLSDVPLGTRVRVRVGDHPRLLIGTLAHRTADSVLIERDLASWAPLILALGDVSAAEVSVGHRTHRALGTLLGAATGLGVGWVIGSARSARTVECERPSPGQSGVDAAGECLVGAAVGATVDGMTTMFLSVSVGALLGYAAGSARRDVWQPVTTSGTNAPGRIAASIGVRRIGLSLTF